ncbi:MAG: formate--tetrahydrofolate ligase, partial [Polaribacter sp.]
MTDIDIAKKATLHHITKIAKQLNIAEDDLEMYGKYKAKLPLSLIDKKKV